MKLIFKIYKKVRELKTEERKVKENIERYKLNSNKYLKEEEDKLKRSILNLKRLQEKGWIDLHCLSKSGYLDQIKEEYKDEDKRLEKRKDALDQQKKELAQREQELNELQQKLNDQILKLAIVQGLNK
jgi:DNA repair exonuclease SbcCD ATPase subunit